MGNVAQFTRTSVGEAGRGGRDGEPLGSWRRRHQEHGAAAAAKVHPETVARLSSELEAFAGELRPSEAHLEQMGQFLRGLEQRLQGAMDGVKVLPFGSAVNGFWTAQSDVDVCVQMPRASTRAAQVKALREISTQLGSAEQYTMEARFGAQVPILHWSPKRPGMVSCDISVNNTLAVVNSRLLGEYVRLDTRMQTLGFCIKAWARARGINDRSRGTLSSFALILMLISFLQRRSPPVLPSLQDIAFSQSLAPDYVNGVDCRYCKDDATIADELVYLQGRHAPNAESVGLLMLEFFRHYGYEYRHGIIRIRDTRSFLPPGDETGYYLVVDNPFEVGKDIANVDASQHDLIKKEFRRGFALLKEGRPFRDLLRDASASGEVVAGRRVGPARRQ